MHTLKVQLGLTLSALLFISMLLFGFVILMLWQRSGIQQETLDSKILLRMVAASLVDEEKTVSSHGPPKEILSCLNGTETMCLQWQNSSTEAVQSYGSCPTGLSLTDILNNASTSGHLETLYSGMTWNGFFLTKQYLLMAIPLQFDQKNQGSIALVRSLDQVSASIHDAQKIFFTYLLVNIIIFAIIGFTRLLHLVIRPIKRLASLADSRTELSDTSFFSGDGLGEFNQLSLSLNRLLSRIDDDKQELRSTVESLKIANDELQRNRDEMLRTEKLASIGRLSAGLAHEIGNPLGIIQGYVDLLTDASLNDEDRKSFCKRATEELSRINDLTRNLLDLSRSSVAASIEKVDLHNLLQDLISTVSIKKTSVPIAFQTNFSATDSEVIINSDGLRQVFFNCIFNSIDGIEEVANGKNGRIIVTTENQKSELGEQCGQNISISIQDNGIGIKPEYEDAVFDPFFTTKEVGKGTGLGLAVAHNIIKTAGGTITMSSQSNNGATISITLPLSSQPKKGHKA
ncbi:MAG TPA: hypothetical protein EYP35_00910 [Desulfobacterales bacterium]|nr:hypothetical protein [Desulfobacterales bacterium]HIP38598.1 hypothetical protein [Desulfocapsa sulfexigens]